MHTQVSRGSLSLKFDGLVIVYMATDILGGTNFIIDLRGDKHFFYTVARQASCLHDHLSMSINIGATG